MSSNFYECYLIEKRRLSLNRERRQDVYKRKKRKKKKEQTLKKAQQVLCFLNMSLNGCVSFFYGEWRSLYHSLVTLMILLYIYFTEMASKWQKCEGLKERCMYHSVGLLINNCTFTRYIRWTEKNMRSRKKKSANNCTSYGYWMK